MIPTSKRQPVDRRYEEASMQGSANEHNDIRMQGYKDTN